MLAVAAFAGAAVPFVVGAVVVDVVRDDLGNGTTEPVETAAEEEGDAPSSDLPRAYVVTRTRDNPTILSPVYEEFVSLTLDPGMYQVWGKLGVSNRDGERSFQVECTLVPSDADGTPRGTERAGEAGSDYGDLRLGPHDTPGDSGTIPLAISQVLRAQGTVVLACRGYGNDYGAFMHYGSIRAIRVGSITEIEAPTP